MTQPSRLETDAPDGLTPEAAGIALSDYSFETLHRHDEYIVSRARAIAAGPSFLVVEPAAEHPSPSTVEKMANACSLAGELKSEWAARPLALKQHRGRTVLIAEDPGGEPLDRSLGAPMELGQFLKLAIGIATALSHFHARGLIHKDIKPGKILIDASTGHAWLTGFGIAARLPRERPVAEPPGSMAGTLAYMAPEQTGWMNRSVDSRSDLYSLGVTLYEMLTGALPFSTADPLELLHSHIARRPPSPAERAAGLPSSVSDIVMKLLAKPPEDRYQTAAAVAEDLRCCLRQWQSGGEFEPFALGAGDISGTLRVPEKLYGRDREAASLVAAFERVVSNGRPEVVLVSGYSGIGKSSLVNELRKAVVTSRALFASGKVDHYKRDIPYAALAQALRNLVLDVLSRSEAELDEWRADLTDALGWNGQLMVSLVPELELIIGKQPSVSEVGALESHDRFQNTFRNLIGVFARPEHPLALFIDDLQWLDAATLTTLVDLATQPSVRHLLLVGAYRDNEVDSSHPLIHGLDAIRASGRPVHEILVTPLTLDDVAELVADAIHKERERARPLAQLVYQKTAGNPFFVIQFLTALAEENLLTFAPDLGAWDWDPARIDAKGYTANVADLLVEKLTRMPLTTQEALKQLACLGTASDIGILSLIHERSRDEVEVSLREALRAGFVFHQKETYRFLHDRIQEAAYSLIPQELRAAEHLRIGRLLYSQLERPAIEERIFDIVNQFNRATVLLKSLEEREQVAELNLLAGKRAKNAAAYNSALDYFIAGTALLPDDAWERRYELSFALEYHRSQCEFLTGMLAAADERLSMLAHRAGNLVDLAAVTCLDVSVQQTLHRSDRAVERCLQSLRTFGIALPLHPSKEDVQEEIDRTWSQLGSRPIEAILDLPPATDNDSRAAMDVLAALLRPSTQTDYNLFYLVSFRMVHLSLEHGNASVSAFGYLCAGSSLVYFGEFEAAFRFGKLSVDLVQRQGDKRLAPRIGVTFACTVLPWTRHIRSGYVFFKSNFDAARQSDDLTYAAVARRMAITNFLASGEPLAEVERQAAWGLDLARKAKFGVVADAITAQLRFIRMLRGLTSAFGSFTDAEFDEAEFEQHLQSENIPVFAACEYQIYKLQARLLAGDHESALAAGMSAHALLWTTPFHFERVEYHFYAALAHAAACGSGMLGVERDTHRQVLQSYHGQLDTWAKNCPENFESRAALVAAEIARTDGRELDAMRSYEQAIRSAQINAFVQIEAIASELYGRFCLDRGLTSTAYAQLRNARDCYTSWGADGKVRQLDRLYPDLRREQPVAGPTATIAAPVEQLDLATVMEVSQAVSGEIILEKLVEIVMRKAMEHAGAERGLLILPHGAELHIEAEATTAGASFAVRQRDEPVSPAHVPESLLRYVVRTLEHVIIDDASAQHSRSTDEYFRQRRVRSVLCLPLLKQGELNAVLYLENNLAPNVFTHDRLQILKVLASQAAISLENSRLYSGLQEREAKIRRLVDSNLIGVMIANYERDQLLEANDAVLKLLGYTRQDLVEGRIRGQALTPPEWQGPTQRAMARFKATGVSEVFEKEYFRKDGSRVPVLVGGARLGGSQSVAFVLDLTELKRAEEEARRSEKELRDLISEMPAMAFSIRPDGSTEFLSRRCLEYVGSDNDWQSTIHPEDFDAHMSKWRASLESGVPFENEVRHRSITGEYRWFLARAVPLRDEDGRIVKWYGTLTDIEDRKRAEALLTGEKRILEMVAKGDSLPHILDSLCRLVEDLAGGVLASILLVEGDRLRHGGAPSLPRAYTEAIDGVLIGPSVGSCGTAAYRGKQVIVEDIAADPLWADYREAALPHSLRACWSTPIFSSQGKVIATFAMYYREPRRPRPHDQEFIEQISDLAGVAIQRKLTEQALRRSEAYLAEAERLSHTGSWASNPDMDKAHYWSEEMFRIWGFDPQQGPPGNDETFQRIHPEDLPKIRDLLERALSRRLTTDYEADHRILLPDGTVRHIHGTAHPIFDESGQLAEYLGTAVDVTEQVRNREALEKAFEEIKELKDQLYKENLALRDEVVRTSMFEEIIGASTPLQSVLTRVSKVGPTDSTVLIMGETGTGKELVARAIHRRSRRSGRAFVSVNCAALAPSLISSELFGHEKGAFTGATQRRLGRFELADGGTIFLDEIGELPPDTQVALLRVLQEREFERVGGAQSVQVDVRVIAATNRDLKTAIANGAFRQDLFYRLNVFPIDVPPLRHRKDDLLMLVEYFVQRFSRAAGKQIRSIEKETVELFESYDWPGNIRELQNVVERSVILTSGEVLRIDESWLSNESSEPFTPVPASRPFDGDDGGERQIIEAALTGSRGRVSGPKGAAAKLGIPASTLESRIKALKIQKSQFKFR